MKIVGKKDISGARERAISLVEDKAEKCRLAQSAGGAVLTAVYSVKVDEARSILSERDGEVDQRGATTRMLFAEARERGISLEDLASEIWQKHQEWCEAMGEIEAARYRAKVEILNSNCVATIGRIAENFSPQEPI